MTYVQRQIHNLRLYNEYVRDRARNPWRYWSFGFGRRRRR